MGKPCESIADYLTGMTVLTYSEDPVAAAKVAEDFAKENKKFEILGGAMGENALDRAGVEAVSKMPSREELIASIVGHASAHLLRTLPGPLAHLLRISLPSSPRSIEKAEGGVRQLTRSDVGIPPETLEHNLRYGKPCQSWLI